MKLYEISNEFESLINQVDENGEIEENVLEEIEKLNLHFEDKALSIAFCIKNFEAEAQAIKHAIENMKDRESKLLNKAAYLSNYLQDNLQKMDITEIKSSPYFQIKLKKCPVSVEVFDENLLPAFYLKEKISLSIDKMAIKIAIQNGKEVPGATLQHNIKLQIK